MEKITELETLATTSGIIIAQSRRIDITDDSDD